MSVFRLLLLFIIFLGAAWGCGESSRPDPPVGLTGTVSSSQVNLTWRRVSEATSYRVYRGTVSGALQTKTLLASDLAGTTFTDATIDPTIVYFYQVTSVNSQGESAGSSEFSTASVTLPAPTGLNATNFLIGVTLTWNGVSGSSGYNIYRSTATGPVNLKLRIATNVPTTTFQDTTVATGASYFYQVSAVNDSQESLPSNEVRVNH